MSEQRDRYTDTFLADDGSELHVGDAIRAVDPEGNPLGFYRITTLGHGSMKHVQITKEEAGENPKRLTIIPVKLYTPMKVVETGKDHVSGDAKCPACCNLGDGSRWPQLHSVASRGLIKCEGYMHREEVWDRRGNSPEVLYRCDRCGSSDY